MPSLGQDDVLDPAVAGCGSRRARPRFSSMSATRVTKDGSQCIRLPSSFMAIGQSSVCSALMNGAGNLEPLGQLLGLADDVADQLEEAFATSQVCCCSVRSDPALRVLPGLAGALGAQVSD